MIKLRPAVDVLLSASADQGRDYMSETTEAMQSGGARARAARPSQRNSP